MISKYEPKDIKPYYPATLDIETNSTGVVIALGFAYELNDKREYSVYHSWQEFIDHLIELSNQVKDRKKVLTIFAHNGGGFDWLSFIEYLDDSSTGEIKQIFLSNSKMIGAVCNITGIENQVRLMDSLCLLPSSLNKVTSMFEVEHKKLDLGDNRLPEEIYNTDRELFYKYLKHDVMGLQETLFSFWNYIYDNDGSIGHLPMTLASLSMRLWRKDLDKEIMVSWNDNLKEFERRSYRGGRVELFQKGEHEKVMVHDINSLYPSVMVNNQYPISYKGYWTYNYYGKFGLYEITYEQTNKKLPPLLRDENTNEFSYVGYGVYTNFEIEKLLELGGTFQLHKGYVYQETGEIFNDYVNKWYGRRLEHKKEGNKGFEYLCKILLNSLYGKFGQKEYSWGIQLMVKENFEKWMENGIEFIAHGDYAMVKEPVKVEYTFVAIASFVTSYARLKLYDYMQQVIENGYDLFYTDTDSVHHSGYRLDTDNELGSMKLEFEGRGIYLARKLYELTSENDRKVVAKGIGKSAQNTITENDFINLTQEGIEKEVEFLTFPTVRDVILKREKSCKPNYKKRTVRQTQKVSQFIVSPE